MAETVCANFNLVRLVLSSLMRETISSVDSSIIPEGFIFSSFLIVDCKLSVASYSHNTQLATYNLIMLLRNPYVLQILFVPVIFELLNAMLLWQLP